MQLRRSSLRRQDARSDSRADEGTRCGEGLRTCSQTKLSLPDQIGGTGVACRNGVAAASSS